jgi:hypothetical protein
MAEAIGSPKRFSLLKKILLGIIGILAAFAGIVALQPAEFRIVRSARISAPAPAIFAQVNDFHRWEAWSPWEKRDSAMKKSFEGPGAGAGAVYSWAGNSEVGEGRMTLTESRPAELIRIQLDFLKPFAATNTTEFTFKQDGTLTDVTWSMSGRKDFMSKAFCMFMDMDKTVGADFEKGLAQMKAVTETPTGK